MEVIRMALGAAPNSTMQRHPNSTTAPPANAGKGVMWRTGTEKYIFLVTDEDSDCPVYDVNRFFQGATAQCTTPGFIDSDNDGTYEPTKSIASNAAWPALPNPWQQDTMATANAIVRYQAHMTLFVKPSNGRTVPQFGDPTNATQVQSADFSLFNRSATLSRLIAANLSTSLQAITLNMSTAYDLRIFNTLDILSPNVVDNVFAAIINTIRSDCFGRKRDALDDNNDKDEALQRERKRQAACR